MNAQSKRELTSAATAERISILRRMSASERRAIGLRLQAIHGGKNSQRMYRLRGIDPCAIARAARKAKREARLRQEELGESKRSKVIGWQ